MLVFENKNRSRNRFIVFPKLIDEKPNKSANKKKRTYFLKKKMKNGSVGLFFVETF